MSDASDPNVNGAAAKSSERSEEALRRSEQRYRALVEASGQAVWSWAPAEFAGDFHQIQAWWGELTGQPIEDQRKSHFAWLDVVHPDDRATAEATWKSALATGVPYDAEYRVRARTGGWRHVKARGVPIPDPDGTPREWVGTLLDVTEQRQAEDARRQSEQWYRGLVTATSDVVYRMSPDWAEMRHLDGRAFIADTAAPRRSWLEVYVPADEHARVAAAVAEAVREKRTFELEHRVLRVDGTIGWAFSRAIPILDARGDIVEWFGAASDVTERKRAEADLRDAQARLEATLAAGEVATWTWDVAADRVVADRNLVRLFGVSDADARGGPIANYISAIHPDDREATAELIRRSMATGEAYEARYRVRHADGGYRTVIARGKPEYDAGRTITRLPGVVLDVSRQARAEEELRASEHRRRLALDSAGLGSWNIDAAANTLVSDERFQDIFAGGTGPVTLEQAYAVVHPEDRDRVRAAVTAAMNPADPMPYEAEYRVVRPDGTVRWVLGRGRANFEGTGAGRTLLSLDGTVADVTDRVLAGQAAGSGQERLRAALAAARMVAWEWTPADRKLRVSENAADVFGLPPGVGLTGIDQGLALLHSDDVAGYTATFRKAIDDRGSYRTHYRLIRPSDGRMIWIEEQGYAVFDQPGGEVRLYGVAADVTARRETEELARAGEEKYRTLFETMDEGFCVIDVIFDDRGAATDYRFVEVNPAFVKHSGPANAVGRTMRELVPAHDQVWYDIYGRVATTGEPVRLEERSEGMGGRWWDVYAFRLGGADSRRVAVLFNEVTTRKRAEEELRRLAAELSETDRRKDEFLATLAHELRNPLAPIRNGLQVLAMADRAEVRERAVAMMGRQLGQMARLVDDLMDVSRITRGKLELKRERVPLADVLASAVETSRPLIDQMGHELVYAPPDRGVVVDADLARLAQVFLNLLNNAAKYMERGGRIWLTVARDSDRVAVAVRDAGVGIAADQLPRVFDLFSQVDQSLEKAQGGLGIGLTLVRRLAEMHGGTVEAHSAGPGTGAEFVVRLPVVAASAPASGTHEERPTPAARRVLVVDDNRDGADSLSEMMALMGNDTQTVYDGEAAVAAAAAFRPDVILLDIGLPKLNGYEACRCIRAQQNDPRPVIIAQTGWGADEDRRRTREAGFDYHLVKPVDPTALLKLLADVTAKR